MNLYESNSCEVFCMWFTSMNSILQFSLSSGRESGVTTRCHGNMSCVLISFIICDLVKKKTIDARLIMGERRVGQSTRGCTQRNWGLAAFVAFMLYLLVTLKNHGLLQISPAIHRKNNMAQLENFQYTAWRLQSKQWMSMTSHSKAALETTSFGC